MMSGLHQGPPAQEDRPMPSQAGLQEEEGQDHGTRLRGRPEAPEEAHSHIPGQGPPGAIIHIITLYNSWLKGREMKNAKNLKLGIVWQSNIEGLS